MDGLAKKGWDVHELHMNAAVRSPDGERGLVSEVGSADLVVLSFPTYIDSTPAAMVKAMTLLAQQRAGRKKAVPLAAIANCGFHEAGQNGTALEICRLFARDAGFEWNGGLALGGGPAIDGRPLAETGGVGRRARRSLDMAAEALAEGGAVPDEAIEIMAKGGVPRWIYTLTGNRRWKERARRSGVDSSLRDRLHTEEKK
jgi:hypothetical protein